jgi:hypothetical protein
MSVNSTDPELRHDLIGRSWEGSFTIDPEAHRKFCSAVFVDDWDRQEAHPLFLHLVAHCGKGVSLEEFFRVLGTELAAGVTFGEGRLESRRPLRIGETYRVVTRIDDVVRKKGSRGPFDLITCRIEMIADPDEVVGVSHESFVVPRTGEQQ